MLLKFLLSTFVGLVGLCFYFVFCIAVLAPLFFILGISSMEAVLHHELNTSTVFLGIAASVAALDSFFIKKISPDKI
jgi:hypothetical protein